MNRTRAVLLFVAGIVVAFLIGFAWQYMRAERLERELEATRRELIFSYLEATLAAAAVSAHRGAHDVALTLTSDYFTGMQEHQAMAPPDAREDLPAILMQRDAVIAGLSRSQPETSDVLARMLVRHRVAFGGPERALPIAAQPPSGSP